MVRRTDAARGTDAARRVPAARAAADRVMTWARLIAAPACAWLVAALACAWLVAWVRPAAARRRLRRMASTLPPSPS